MAKYQLILILFLVLLLSADAFGREKGIKEKAKALFGFGGDDDDDDENEEYEEEDLSYTEEEQSRQASTIDEEIMVKMADVKNTEIPVLTLEDQAAVVDKGVDFSKPFDVNIVKKTMAEVVKEKLPESAPAMSVEELIDIKAEVLEAPPDPVAVEIFKEEQINIFREANGKPKKTLSYLKVADIEDPTQPAQPEEPAQVEEPSQPGEQPEPVKPEESTQLEVPVEPEEPSQPAAVAPKINYLAALKATTAPTTILEKAKDILEETVQHAEELLHDIEDAEPDRKRTTQIKMS